MHYYCEIIIPPTDDIQGAVDSIMKPFDEQPEGEDRNCNPFWDYWKIGGRWAGTKLLARYDKERLDAFHAWMRAENITVSCVTAGKETLQPASQIGKVDAKWHEMFPSDTVCPLFDHCPETLDSDICSLKDALDLTPERVIFGGPSYSGKHSWDGPIEATYMLCESQWNGVNHMPIKWDGTVRGALDSFREGMDRYSKEYRPHIDPQDNWLAVTVDYHS